MSESVFFFGVAYELGFWILASLNQTQRKAILVVKELEKKGISIEMLENMTKNPEIILRIILK